VILILNILFAGTGTLITAFWNISEEGPNAEGTITIRRAKYSKTTLVVALMQMVLSMIIIGWVWSVYWGYLIFTKSLSAPVVEQENQIRGDAEQPVFERLI
jgi:hypothetical protein